MDIQELKKLYEKANLPALTSFHIVSAGYEHLANLTTAPDKPFFCVMDRKEVMDWFAAMHNAFPEIVKLLEKDVNS